jgi:hypothetical protein
MQTVGYTIDMQDCLVSTLVYELTKLFRPSRCDAEASKGMLCNTDTGMGESRREMCRKIETQLIKWDHSFSPPTRAERCGQSADSLRPTFHLITLPRTSTSLPPHQLNSLSGVLLIVTTAQFPIHHRSIFCPRRSPVQLYSFFALPIHRAQGVFSNLSHSVKIRLDL